MRPFSKAVLTVLTAMLPMQVQATEFTTTAAIVIGVSTACNFDLVKMSTVRRIPKPLTEIDLESVNIFEAATLKHIKSDANYCEITGRKIVLDNLQRLPAN